VRFYLDEDLSPEAAKIARGHGIDVISSHECSRNGLGDEVQLRLAAEEGRCFVTRNRDDFVRFSRQFWENGWPHAGVLIVPRSIPNDRFTGLAQALVAFARDYPDGLSSYAVAYLRATPSR
jgi:hypothetical protein